MSSLAFACALVAVTSLFSVQSAQAGYMVTLRQVGPDVVAMGSGPIDLTGLSIVGHGIPTDAEIEPQNGGIFTGQPAFSDPIKARSSGPTHVRERAVRWPGNSQQCQQRRRDRQKPKRPRSATGLCVRVLLYRTGRPTAARLLQPYA